VTPTEPPRRPKPITRKDAEEVAARWHDIARSAVTTPLPPWEEMEPEARNELTGIAYQMLDLGEIVALDHREAHAVTELLANVDVDADQADAAPLDNAFKADLVRAFCKLAFASGRHYGLTNFDMGIEEEPS
jgi:hypothetical protein